jgi:glycosyltransferase involved in cell wall biosynthesis
MKLFVDAHVFDDLNQGSKTYLRGLYGEVCDQAQEDQFYFAANRLSSVTAELGERNNVHALQYKSPNKFLRLGWHIPNLIRKQNADAAHFQYISPLRKVCPEIVTVHDLLFLDYPYYFPLSYRISKRMLFERSAKRADWVVTVSKYSKEALVRHFQINPDKIVITPNGILDYFWDPQPVDSNIGEPYGLSTFILYVSRFEPRKNHAGLLQSYIELELWKQGIQLAFAGGKGIRSERFDQLYNTLTVEQKKFIIFLGDVSLPDLKWLYQRCFLFAYPSFAEGFGIPSLEALACGANVICSNTTAMSEFTFLKDGLFDPNNQGDLTEKLKLFTLGQASSNQSESRDWVKKNYTWKSSAATFLDMLH